MASRNIQAGMLAVSLYWCRCVVVFVDGAVSITQQILFYWAVAYLHVLSYIFKTIDFIFNFCLFLCLFNYL